MLPHTGRVSFSLGLVSSLIIVSSLINLTNLFRLNEAREWETHSDEVITKLEDVYATFQKSETLYYNICMNNNLVPTLEPVEEKPPLEFQQIMAILETEIEYLGNFVVDNPIQVTIVSKIKETYLKLSNQWGEGIRYSRKEGSIAWLSEMWLIDQKYMNIIQSSVDQFRNNEIKLLDKRKMSAARFYLISQGSILASAVLGLVAVFVAYYFFKNHLVSARTAEKDLRDREQRYRFLTNAVPVMLWSTYANGAFDYGNDQWKQYVSCGEGDNELPTWEQLLHPEERDRIIQSWQLALLTGATFQSEGRLKRGKDQSYRWHLLRAVPRQIHNGTIVQWIGTCVDIDEQKRINEDLAQLNAHLDVRVLDATEELRKQTFFLNSVLNNMAEGLMVVDCSGKCLFSNPAANRWFGTRFEQQLWPECVSDLRFYQGDLLEECTVHQLPLSRAIQGEESKDCEIYITNPSQTDGIWCSCNAVPLYDEKDNIFAGLVVFRDITEHKLTQQNLLKAKEMAELANQAKSQFLANMSHEIRTPMNGILGLTELVLDSELTTGQRDFLLSVKQSGESLLHLINDILDFSKIEAGELTLHPCDFSLRDSIADILKPLALRAHRKGLELVYHIPPDVPDLIHADLDRLRQVIVNLVGNSIKFTEKGEIILSIQCVKKGAPCLLHFSVKDTGIGIPSDHLQSIFSPFVQVDGSLTRKFGGTGLGLSISRQIVAKMSGQIQVDSVVGKGSEFFFTVPIWTGTTRCQDGHELDLIDLSGQRVLVIDDNTTHMKIMDELIRNWGMEAILCDRTSDALELLAKANATGEFYSFILLDEVMPDLNGIELIQIILQVLPKSSRLIVLLSSLTPLETIDFCRQQDNVRWLSKPVKHSDLLETMQQLKLSVGKELKQNGSIEQNFPSERPLKQRKTDTETAQLLPSLRPLKILVAEDNPINQKVISQFLTRKGHELFIAENGLRAIELFEHTQIDLILMDIQMPQVDGLEATRVIRTRYGQRGQNIPIIALTAHALQGDRERFLNEGMNGYVTKPINSKLLFEAIAECLPLAVCSSAESAPIRFDQKSIIPVDNTQSEMSDSRHESVSPVTLSEPEFSSACPGSASDFDREIFDAEVLLHRLGNDQDLYLEIIEMFQKDQHGWFDELQLAVTHQDYSALGKIAHTLKGTLGNLSATRAAQTAQQLEKSASLRSSENLESLIAQFKNDLHELLHVMTRSIREIKSLAKV